MKMNNKPRIVTVSGKAGAGKDTFANILARYIQLSGKTVYRIAYADLVKFISTTYYNWNGEKDEIGRSILQNVGTAGRNQYEDFWIHMVRLVIDAIFIDADYVIISDARYPNELSYWKEEGYPNVNIKIERPGLESKLTPEQQQHLSETALDDYTFNVVIVNEEISDLEDEAEDLVISWKYLPVLFGTNE